MDRLYIVVRADLPPGARIAQSIHAALQIAAECPSLVACWLRDSGNLVVLEAADEPALVALRARAVALGIPASLFREVDLGGAATALALGPGARRMVSSLPLAMKPIGPGRGIEATCTPETRVMLGPRSCNPGDGRG